MLPRVHMNADVEEQVGVAESPQCQGMCHDISIEHSLRGIEKGIDWGNRLLSQGSSEESLAIIWQLISIGLSRRLTPRWQPELSVLLEQDEDKEALRKLSSTSSI